MCEKVAVAVDVVVFAAAAAVAGPLVGLQLEAKELMRLCSLGTCVDALHVVSGGPVEMEECCVLGFVNFLCVRKGRGAWWKNS